MRKPKTRLLRVDAMADKIIEEETEPRPDPDAPDDDLRSEEEAGLDIPDSRLESTEYKAE